MKRILPILIFTTCISSFLVSQITIDNSTFPTPGDTLRTVTDNFYTNFDKDATGEQLWDFTDLSGSILLETVFNDASEGEHSDLFPDADMVVRRGAFETYYQSFNNKIIESGRSGLDPILNLLDITYYNSGELVFRRAPMSYGDHFSDQSSFVITAPSSIIPDSLAPGLGNLVDSLRLEVASSIVSDIDGWGTLKLPDSEYDVLRQKSVNTVNSVLFIYNQVFGWQEVDPSNPLFANFADILAQLGERTITSYQFFANDNKEIIADVLASDTTDVVAVVYKGDMTSGLPVVNAADKNVLAYPNPTFGNITFELRNLPRDRYKVVIYNIIGKKLWEKQMDMYTGRLVADVSHLRRGTYLYSVIDSKGLKVSTKRLMIITP